MAKKEKDKKNIIIGVLAVIIVLLGGLSVYALFIKKNDNVDDNKSIETEKQEEKNNFEEPKGDYELTVYKDKYSGSLNTSNTKNQYVTEAFKIKVSTPDARVLDIDRKGLSFVIYNDNGVKIYDVKSKMVRSTNLSGNYKNYNLFESEDENKIIGIGFQDKNDYIGYYNISLNKELYYDKKYKNGSYPFMEQLTDDYLSLTSVEGAYILNANKDKVELFHKYEENEGYWYKYWNEQNGNDNIYLFGSCPDVCIVKEMYNNELKKFYSGSIEEYSFYNNNIYLKSNNVIEKYSNKGELIDKINKYSDIKGIANNYVIYLNNKNLVLENIDNLSESVVVVKDWKDWWDYDYAAYYDRKILDEMNEKNKKEGLYIVMYYGYDNNGAIKNAEGNYGMEYCYTPDKQIVEYPIKTELGGRAKPVLYLYPEKEMDVMVKFSKPELLTTTYPKYINSWNVKVSPNGDMYDKDGKYYYALYWDEKRYNEVDFSEGFYVEEKDAIAFLEEKLEIIGLNAKERNEFIMYWLPIMERNDKNLVYFELTEERELENQLIIEPKPDSMLRLSIHIKKVNQRVNIKEQKLETFNRVGFTVIEWGGMTY